MSGEPLNPELAQLLRTSSKEEFDVPHVFVTFGASVSASHCDQKWTR